MQLDIIVATLEGCLFSELNDSALFERVLEESVAVGGFTPLNTYVHQFEPQGVTASVVLSESHIALHSWPEHCILFVDMATCAGAGRTERAFEHICTLFRHTEVNRKHIDFGDTPKALPAMAAPLSALLPH